mmetsp:Transcript_23509/g.61835  ORF Transcript_23509/g.61835 Transcript_23509/m.61835 type:complete len:170 (+) Transcript_23509:371-880(+)
MTNGGFVRVARLDSKRKLAQNDIANSTTPELPYTVLHRQPLGLPDGPKVAPSTFLHRQQARSHQLHNMKLIGKWGLGATSVKDCPQTWGHAKGSMDTVGKCRADLTHTVKCRLVASIADGLSDASCKAVTPTSKDLSDAAPGQNQVFQTAYNSIFVHPWLPRVTVRESM